MSIPPVKIFHAANIAIAGVGTAYLASFSTMCGTRVYERIQTNQAMSVFHSRYPEQGCTAASMKVFFDTDRKEKIDDGIYRAIAHFVPFLNQFENLPPASLSDPLSLMSAEPENFVPVTENVTLYKVHAGEATLSDANVSDICYFIKTNDGDKKLVLQFDQPLNPSAQEQVNRIIKASGPRVSSMIAKLGEPLEFTVRRAIYATNEPNHQTTGPHIPR